MESLSFTEENYLKAIFKICEQSKKSASTNAIAKRMNTSAASVTDMLQRLSGKLLINYEKYKGVTLTESGNRIATNLIRKHRLWEVFLVDKLKFSWGAVHEIAEELEHIKSDELVERLDEFLEHPKFDPHGDPIPDAEGNFTFRQKSPLSKLKIGEKGIVIGVQENSTTFLNYLDQLKLSLGSSVEVIDFFEYDESLRILLNGKETTLSNKVSQNLFIQKD
jgi:DtxR family Mn-dependent transcriptional regulator